jgi:tRNA pseudouridine55 synthase
MDGVLLLDKPSGLGSQEALKDLRRRFGIKKLGHTGTLDPIASGLLIICLGKATRITQYLMDLEKEYLAKVLLGTITDTDDITGRIIEKRELLNINYQKLLDTLLEFTGEITQLPPKYSAIKLEGKRSYKLAREDKDPQPPPRTVKIHKIEIINVKPPSVSFRISCSKGTYVRSIARDLGEKLGCGGTLEELRRVRIGHISVDEARKPKELTKEALESSLIPIDRILSFMQGYNLSEKEAMRFQNGLPVKVEVLQNGYFRVYQKDKFMGVGEFLHGLLYPRKILYQ